MSEEYPTVDNEILKLNKRITTLLTENCTLGEMNQRLRRDYDNLRGKMEEHRQSAIESCELSDKYKFDLEKEIQIREAIFEAHQKQKTKFLNLNEENYILKERVKKLENDMEQRRPSQPFNSIRSSFVGTHWGGLQLNDPNSRASISHSPMPSRRPSGTNKKSQEIIKLNSQIEKLNKDLAEAYELINSLEFELDSLFYYEKEVTDLQAKLDALSVNRSPANKNTNPFNDDCDDDDNDNEENDEDSESQLHALDSEDKTAKRLELKNKLKIFLGKKESGSVTYRSSALPDLHESLKTI